MSTETWQDRGFGLYVHWPFCEAKCPYCDFNSHVVRSIDQRRWAKALAAEIGLWASRTPGRVLGSVFFGGGTPSLMTGETVDTVMTAIRDGWTCANDLDVTLEANPRSVEAGRFRDFAAAGVTRVSMGVQSLRDDDLRRLGRTHSAAEARAAFDVARSAFDRVSFDLIYARQGQSLEAWDRELREALGMAVDHLSLYQLTIEPGTAFWDRQRAGGLKGLPDDDLAADMYLLTQDVCGAAGLPGYEVSNHARPGAESRHNLVYWRSGDWIGVGPGAHGRVTIDGARLGTVGWTQPATWLNAAEAGDAEELRTEISDVDRAAEYLMMGLRLTEGIDVAPLYAAPGFEGLDLTIDRYVADGLLWRRGARIGTTPEGRLLLNALLRDMLPD